MERKFNSTARKIWIWDSLLAVVSTYQIVRYFENDVSSSLVIGVLGIISALAIGGNDYVQSVKFRQGTVELMAKHDAIEKMLQDIEHTLVIKEVIAESQPPLHPDLN